MTTPRTEPTIGPGTTPRPSLLTRSTCLTLLASVGGLTGFDLLFAVVPVQAAARHGTVAAGVCTGALLLGTVLVEPAVPRAMHRYGERGVLAAGLLLLGLPTFGLVISSHLSAMVGISSLRGVGLGIVVVAGTAMTAAAVPAERRNEAMGLYGVAVGIPAVVCLPLGVWLTDRFGFSVVVVAAGVAALLVLPTATGVPRTRDARPAPTSGCLPGQLRRDGLLPPLIVMGAVTLGAGVLLTFVPLALPAEHAGLTAVVLLAQSGSTPLARWVTGRCADRIGPERLLRPAVLVAATGMVGMVGVSEPSVAIAGMVLFGAGFGMAQSVTLAVMLDRVPPDRIGRVSALWNLAYDGGLGLGALGFGLVLGPLGYGLAFGLAGLLLLGALVPSPFPKTALTNRSPHVTLPLTIGENTHGRATPVPS